MKKTVFALSLLLVGSTFFSSCNKKLKEDIEELEKQVGDLQNENGNLQQLLGTNEPIYSTTTYYTDTDSLITIKGTFKFKSSDGSTQLLSKQDDGTYRIYIERFSDVDWNEGAWVEFYYDPATEAISNANGGHYWSDDDQYYDNAYYDYSVTPAPTVNITLHSINLTTGQISLTFSATGSDAYTTAAQWWQTPNQGKSMTTNFSFSGKLGVFQETI